DLCPRVGGNRGRLLGRDRRLRRSQRSWGEGESSSATGAGVGRFVGGSAHRIGLSELCGRVPEGGIRETIPTRDSAQTELRRRALAIRMAADLCRAGGGSAYGNAACRRVGPAFAGDDDGPQCALPDESVE